MLKSPPGATFAKSDSIVSGFEGFDYDSTWDVLYPIIFSLDGKKKIADIALEENINIKKVHEVLDLLASSELISWVEK